MDYFDCLGMLWVRSGEYGFVLSVDEVGYAKT